MDELSLQHKGVLILLMRFPQLSENKGSKDKSAKVVRGERRGRDEENEKDFQVKGHLPL